jgi:hypothetical protein
MPQPRDHIVRKHQKIKEEYKALHAQGFRHDFIVPKLAEKYFHSRKTIENIIWETGGYAKYKPKKPNKDQLDLF